MNRSLVARGDREDTPSAIFAKLAGEEAGEIEQVSSLQDGVDGPVEYSMT